MTLIADASSLILLAKAEILSALIEKNEIIIPEKVHEETARGKEKGMPDSFLIEKLIEENKIKVEKANEKTKGKVKEMFGLWAGEGEALSLAIEHNKPIITDDKKCINAAKAANISFMTSPDITIALFQKKQIDKKKAVFAIEKLEEAGWYKKEIIEIYKE